MALNLVYSQNTNGIFEVKWDHTETSYDAYLNEEKVLSDFTPSVTTVAKYIFGIPSGTDATFKIESKDTSNAIVESKEVTLSSTIDPENIVDPVSISLSEVTSEGDVKLSLDYGDIMGLDATFFPDIYVGGSDPQHSISFMDDVEQEYDAQTGVLTIEGLELGKTHEVYFKAYAIKADGSLIQSSWTLSNSASLPQTVTKQPVPVSDHLFDGDSTTSWNTGEKGKKAYKSLYTGWDFGKEATPDSLKVEQASTEYGITDVIVESSTDGIEWEEVASGSIKTGSISLSSNGLITASKFRVIPDSGVVDFTTGEELEDKVVEITKIDFLDDLGKSLIDTTTGSSLTGTDDSLRKKYQKKVFESLTGFIEGKGPENAFDGDDATDSEIKPGKVSSGLGNPTGHFVSLEADLDLGNEDPVHKVVLKQLEGKHVTNVKLQYSTNEKDWITVHTETLSPVFDASGIAESVITIPAEVRDTVRKAKDWRIISEDVPLDETGAPVADWTWGVSDADMRKVELSSVGQTGSATESSVTAASINIQSSTNPPANALDGDTATFWESNETGTDVNGAFVVVDFGTSPQQIEKVRTYQPTGYAVSGFTIQSSDDNTTWTDETTHAVVTLDAFEDIVFTASGQHQYWRVLSTSQADGGGTWRLHELELYDASDVSVTSSGTTTESDTTPPAQPTDLAATEGDSQVVLAWTANTEADLAGYNVYDVTTGSPVLVNTSLVTDATYAVTGLTNGTAYSFSVTAVDTSNNESPESVAASATPVEDTVPPTAPTGLTASPKDSLVDLSWTENTEADLAGYHVHVDGVKVTTSLVKGVTYQATGLTNETEYTFEVYAEDVNGNLSSASASVTATPFLIPDSGFIAINLQAIVNDDVKTVKLKWDFMDSTGAILSELPAGYSAHLYLDDIFSNAESTNNQLMVADLVEGVGYKAQVIIVDNATDAWTHDPVTSTKFRVIGTTSGSTDPTTWIGVKLDNITVIYQK